MLYLANEYMMEDGSMNYIFDIDGTLSFDGVSMSKDIIKSLQALKENGHQVVFASARPIRDMMEIIPKEFHDSVWIGGNGAFTKVDGHIDCHFFDEETTDLLFKLIEQHQSQYLADGKWDFSYTGPNTHPLYQNINTHLAENISLQSHEKISKLVLFNPTQSLISALEELPLMMNYHGNENLVDIAPGTCNKYEAISSLNLTPYIAFGNDANDVEMFHHAEVSYCVGLSDYSQYADDTLSIDQVAEIIVATIKDYQTKLSCDDN